MANYSFGFIKPFGFTGSYGYAGSLGLAQIMYQTNLGDFIYTTNPDGTIVLDNYGSLGDTYDGLTYSGRGIELGATNDVDIPIHHTLGADNKKLATSVDTGWTDNLDNTYTGSTVTGDIVGITTLTTGTFKVTITLSSVTAGDVNGYTADGTYVFEETLTASLNLTGTGFTGVVTVVSAEQITNPNSYLTYYDFTESKFIALGNSVDGGSSEELVVNGGFDTDSDWTKNGLWTISGGKAHANGEPGASIIQVANTVVGRYYAMTFTVSDYVSGTVIPHIGGTNLGNITANGTYTVFKVATGLTQGVEFYSASANLSIDNVSFTEILPISTKYTFNNKTVNNILTHSTAWSASDWTRINNNPNLVGKLALETTGATKTIPELDMVMDAGASADKWFMCAEPTLATLYNARSTDSVTIANYAETVRTNADLQQKGIQTTAFVTDGAGTPLSYTSNILNWDVNGYCNHQWNPSLESSFWLEEIVDGVVYQHKYDGVNLTTYTDNVAGTPTAHSPENANYLSGKGVYPKVTADPLTSYQSKTFQLFNGSQYTNYNQTARYAILAAL